MPRAAFAAPAVSISLPSVPERVEPNTPFTITVQYQMDLWKEGLRGRVFLEMRNAATSDLISLQHLDNNRTGYQGPEGSVQFTCSVTDTYERIYFVAYISPIEFNPYVIAEILKYPRDGSYPYELAGNGITHDIKYLGTTIITDNQAGNACYCCGITYQVFMDAWENYNAAKGVNPASIWGITAAQMKTFRLIWYIALGRDSYPGPAKAMTDYKCGYQITDWDHARQGDFVQIWRLGVQDSGHSVIFDKWIRNKSGEKTSIRYWSTQTSTNGINYNSEKYSVLDLEETTFSRAIKPPDDDDWKNRYADISTQSAPTRVGGALGSGCSWRFH
jgi:hypothetical protein